MQKGDLRFAKLYASKTRIPLSRWGKLLNAYTSLPFTTDS